MIKRFFVIIFTFYFSICLFAQKENNLKPMYPGGEKMLADFLSKNLVYPKEANLNRFEGKTFISFCVNENGSLSDFKIQKSSYKILDEEAMRVAQLMNNWVPAHQDGKAKKEMVVLPIQFNLKNIKQRNIKELELK